MIKYNVTKDCPYLLMMTQKYINDNVDLNTQLPLFQEKDSDVSYTEELSVLKELAMPRYHNLQSW